MWFLVILEKSDGTDLIWSSRESDLELEGDRVRIPVIRSREEDGNRDGVLDSLWLNLEMPMDGSEEITGVQALLLFDYKLKRCFMSFMLLIYIFDWYSFVIIALNSESQTFRFPNFKFIIINYNILNIALFDYARSKNQRIRGFHQQVAKLWGLDRVWGE